MTSKEVGNVSVVARFRPLNEREKKHSRDVCVNFVDDFTCEVTDKTGKHQFKFDRVFSINSSQAEVYQDSAKPIVDSVLEGFNGTVFAYGQTGSGKTFTMQGSDIYDPQQKGLIPRMIRNIFEEIQKCADNIEFTMKVGYVEIYLEKIKDLLNPTKTDLKIKEDQLNGIYIADQRMEYVSSELEVFDYMSQGMGNREVGATQMNAGSSRSHSIFNMVITQTEVSTYSSKTGKLYMVDLAGSEKISKTGAEGKRLDEAKNINKSLTMLGMVINALTDKSSTHIPYRDSKLTRVLQDSLGGNSKTALIITCSPSSFNDQETLSTLRFGLRAKKIKNTPTINKEQTVAELRQLLEQAETQLKLKDEKIALLELALKKLQGQEINEIDLNQILPQQIQKREQSDEEKQTDILDLPDIEQEIKAEFEALQEQLEQQKAIAEAESIKAQQYQREFYAWQAKYQTQEREGDSLLMRCQTLQMTIEDLENELNDKEQEIKQVVNENQKLKSDLECIQTLNQAPPLEQKRSIRYAEARESIQRVNEQRKVQNPFQLSQGDNSQLVSELQKKVDQLQKELEQFLKGQTIESLIEKIKQEEHRKCEDEKRQLMNDLDNRCQKVIELELDNNDLQEKYDFVWISKGFQELKQRQDELEHKNDNLNQLYYKNIKKISDIRVKRKIQKNQLARKEEKIQVLTKQLYDLQLQFNDLKRQLEQASQNPISLQQDLPSTKHSKGVVKKIKGGNIFTGRNLQPISPIGQQSAQFQPFNFKEEANEKEEESEL